MDTVLAAIRQAIDTGDPKKALRLCTGALAGEDNTDLLVYKALILLKLNRRQEAYRAALDAKTRVLDTQTSPELLIDIFKSLRKYSHIAEIYEQLFSSTPSLSIGDKLIEAYASEFKFTEQQVICMKLFKQFNAQEYAIRAAECLVLAAKSDRRQGKMTEIAHLILNKLTRGESFRCTEGFVRLYVQVLMEIQAYAEAQDTLDRYAEGIVEEVEKVELQAEIAKRQGDFLKAINCLHSVLRPSVTDSDCRSIWALLQAYIDTLSAAVSSAIQSSPPTIDPPNTPMRYLDSSNKGNGFRPFQDTESVQSILTLAIGNVKGVKDASEGSVKAKDVRREAYLAEMELKRRLIYLGFAQGQEEYKSEGDPGGVFYQLVFKYATTQCEFTSTPEDLIPYIRLMNVSQVVPFREKMKEYIAGMKEHSSNKLRVLKCRVVGVKVMRLVGVFSPPVVKHQGQVWDIVKSLYAQYMEALRTEHPPGHGEVRVADDLILLSCELLLQAPIPSSLDPVDLHNSDFSQYQFSPDSGPITQRLLHCLALLESSLIQSPFNTRLKLALVDLYVKAGALETANRLILSMELAPGEFETLGHLVYGPIRDFCEVVGVLEQMGKRVLLGGEAGRERRLTQMLAAYSSHNLSEILTLRSESIQHDNSLFAFLSKVSCLEIEVYRHLSKGLTEVGQVLHDSSELVSKMCSLRSGYGDLKSTANDSIPYSLGVVPIQSLVYKSAKAKFDLSELNHPNKLTSNTQKTNKIYGFKAEPKKIALKGALFRLYSDAIDGNYEVLDADLRTYAQLLNEQGLITDPSEKIAQLKQTVAMLKTREAAQKAEEALKEQEFYGGRFESEEELQSYKLALSGKFCKYQLMLFEGL